MSQRRMKLSDVEAARGRFCAGRPAPFREVCPTVKSIRVEIRPSGEGFEPYKSGDEVLFVYDENSIPPIFDCQNPRCFGGGLNLDEVVRRYMVEGKLTKYEAPIWCCGYEGSPRGRRNDGPCHTTFRVKITIQYKDAV